MSANEQSVDALLQQPVSKPDASVAASVAAISTPSATQQQSKSSSSYAKIVAVDKDGKPTDNTDTSNTKPKATAESVQLKNRKPHADTAVASTSDSNKNEQKPQDIIDNHGNEIDNEDDSTFTPVVSHNRKDRNQRRNNNNNNNGTRRDRGGNSVGGAEGAASRQGSKRPNRGENERGDRKEIRRSRGKRADKDKNANADQSGGSDVVNAAAKTVSNNSNGEEPTDDPITANDNGAGSTKFVEAPLPKVNAWKVSKISYFKII